MIKPAEGRGRLKQFLIRFQSCLLIAAVALTIGAWAVVQTSGQMKKRQDAEILAHLQSKSIALENNMNAINTLLTQYYQKTRSQRIVNITPDLTEQDRLFITQSIRSLANVWEGFADSEALPVRDVMLYFTKSKIAISSVTMYTLENLSTFYFEMEQGALQEGLERFVQAKSSQQFLTLKGKTRDHLLLMRRFALLGSADSIIGLCVLNESMIDFGTHYDGTIYLATSDGGVFGASADVLPGYGELSTLETATRVLRDGQSYMLMCVEAASDCRMAMLMPWSSYMRSIHLTCALIAGITAVLTVAACMILFHARWSYNLRLSSIGELLHAPVAQDAGHALHAMKTESLDFEQICQSLRHLMDQNQDLQQKTAQASRQLENNRIIMRSSFVRMLILGKVGDADLDDMLRFYHISSDCDRYRVMLLQVDSRGVTLEEADKARQNLLISVSMLDYPCETCVIDDYTVGVLFSYAAGEWTQFQAQINQRVRRITETMRTELGIRVSVGLGNSVTAIAGLPSAYYSARIMLVCSTRTGMRALNPTDRITAEDSERLMRIMHALEQGDAALCMSIFDGIFYPEADGEPNVTQQQRACALVLFNLFDDTVNCNAQLKRLFADDEGINRQLGDCIVFEDVLPLIRGMLESACRCIAATSRDHAKLLVDHAVQLIQQKYTDSNLLQTEIADALEVNATILSVKFKEVMGVNMSLYIRRLRVEHAGRLLRETDLPLDEIAERSGLGSLKTMYRVFKSEMGLTPGKYRESLNGTA